MKRLCPIVVTATLAWFTFGCEKPKTPPVENPPEQPAPKLDVSQIPEPEHTPPAAAQHPGATAQPTPPTEEPITTIQPEAEPSAPKTAKKTTKAKPKEKYASNSKAARTYVVKKGDTLQEISKKYYGTTKNWRKIYEANRSRVKDPDELQVGTKLEIP